MTNIKKKSKSQIKSKEIRLLLNPSIYPLEAIYATCYVFIDRFYIFLDSVNSKIKTSLKPKIGFKVSSFCYDEFMNELLNNTLRLSISKRNKKLREMIVREALFFSQPRKEIDALFISKDKSTLWKNDPQGIAIPWEQKFKTRKKRG